MTYMHKRRRTRFYILLLFVLLAILIVTSSTLGAAKDITVGDAIRILLSRIPGLGRMVDTSHLSDMSSIIILTIRLPRVLLGALVGAGLAMAGAAFQGMFKNPMADPYIIGVSSGAAFGASLAMLFGINFMFLGFSGIGSMAFLGAAAASFLVYSLARVGNKVPVTSLLLSGIAVSSLLSAAISFMMLFNRDRVQTVVFWIMGSLSKARWESVITAFPGIAIGMIVLLFYAKDLNILLMGDETAAHLGVDVERVKIVLLGVCSLIAGSAVAVSGIIGFVGLIIPHVVRLIFGPDHRTLIPLSALTGAIFLLAADILSRVLIQPAEIPVGIITALLGGPFFLYLLHIKKKSVQTYGA